MECEAREARGGRRTREDVDGDTARRGEQWERKKIVVTVR